MNPYSILYFAYGILALIFFAWLLTGPPEENKTELNAHGKRPREYDPSTILFGLLLVGAAVATIGSIVMIFS